MLTVAKIADATLAKRREDANRLREIADRVEAGEITEFAIACNDRENNCFMCAGSFEDRWRMLAAIEYSKRAVDEN